MFYVKISTDMKDNTDRLLEAVEHPERFTDDELTAMLADPSTRELYGLMSKTADALTPPGNPDIDKEWHDFAAAHIVGRRTAWHILRVFLNRHAAAVIMAVVASLAVVAATITFTRSAGSHDPAEKVVIPASSTPMVGKNGGRVDPDTVVTTELADGEIVTFKEEPFERILSALGVHYGVKVTFNSADTKKLRLFFKWDSSLPLSEVVDQLNSFGRIDIRIKGNTLIVE